MHSIELHYTLRPGQTGSSALVSHPLIRLLGAVAAEGSISGAARRLGVSYRHAWGELKRWEHELGEELIIWGKGQSARLTEFASKLMWAERQTQARLAPQIAALQADLERTFAMAFDPQAHVLTLYASHDDALLRLQDAATAQRLHLDIRFCGSVDAIRALNEGRCTLAGFHARHQPSRQSVSAKHYRPLLKPGQHKLIGFALRTQGLMVAPGNPLGLIGLEAIAHLGARYAQRSLGTGTRVLQDELLAEAGLAAHALNTLEQDEPSHAACAARVASGQADVALGIASAAQALGLDFVPLVEETYHLVCLKSTLDTPAMSGLRECLASADWQTLVQGVSGYRPNRSGQVLSLSQTLPWWNFKNRKARP
ncbi:MAG: substrate-binding domain-containing protein [Alphaproteobacteria bacterium]|nr:substrate-binding domain-containing protein [Alphaproteobacteria bacterium]